MQVINAVAVGIKLKTSCTFIKANNKLDSVTGVSNDNIYNYGHGK